MLNLFLTLFVLGYPSPHGHAVRVGDARTGVATVPPAPLAVDFKISDVTLTPGSLFVRKRSRCFIVNLSLKKRDRDWLFPTPSFRNPVEYPALCAFRFTVLLHRFDVLLCERKVIINTLSLPEPPYYLQRNKPKTEIMSSSSRSTTVRWQFGDLCACILFCNFFFIFSFLL